ncbi:RimJ/RimL family protein N-acetyltransferase [Dysgonomonas hofstadii]|uniref:RimJ/RimL family protein N-acetyltransferase n=1 Tax=Dysgonomonas hofstadii TaxID=637886 RepID=A0A840CIG0_9BACT|nr:GNAT family protein [Dysgonomonas hofstadii]MBB4034981.1 RimJ/RimL family protein N-acetyltransferase [Dysgonomonas hofstadii]
MINIRTGRLTVRLARPDDAEAIYSYRSDFIENKYQGWFPYSEQEVRDYMASMPQTLDVAGVCFQFAIVEVDTDRLIGDMAVIFTNHDLMQVEVGCTLDKNFQGKGYAAEALKAMVNHLFIELKKHRVIASVDPRNTASIRLVERLGFRKEAHFKESYYLRGEWVDDVIFALLRKEWIDIE